MESKTRRGGGQTVVVAQGGVPEKWRCGEMSSITGYWFNDLVAAAKQPYLTDQRAIS